MDVGRWAEVFKALANVNRLKIIEMLREGEELTVGQIAEKLKISLKATSNHLALLRSLDVLKPQGKIGHVYYKLNSQLPDEFRKIVDKVLG